MYQSTRTTAFFRRALLCLPLLFGMAGCDTIVLHPAGDVAIQERDLLIFSTLLMLLIIVPVMALTIYFACKYRQSNRKATYMPDWNHSTLLELVIWAGPLFIIIALGALTWMGTHLLDPYRKLDRIAADQVVPVETKALEIDVVALDWKWLFIYPEYGVAVVNQVAAPLNRPIDFHITAANVMNSFYIPALAGQIYAMPGMETRLHAVVNQPGTFKGFSANYSGAGFSKMSFAFLGQSDADFAAWMANARKANAALDQAAYGELQKPSENEPVRFYNHVDHDLYGKIVALCAAPGQSCTGMASMMTHAAPHAMAPATMHDHSKMK